MKGLISVLQTADKAVLQSAELIKSDFRTYCGSYFLVTTKAFVVWSISNSSTLHGLQDLPIMNWAHITAFQEVIGRNYLLCWAWFHEMYKYLTFVTSFLLSDLTEIGHWIKNY